MKSGYWVLLHQEDGDAFQAFHLNTTGLSSSSVTSHAGATYQADRSPYNDWDRMGMMTFNFQGDMLGAVTYHHGDTTSVELCHFDPATGQVQWHASLYSWLYDIGHVPINPTQNSLDFDVTGRYVYIDEVRPGRMENNIFPFDLSVLPDRLEGPDRLW